MPKVPRAGFASMMKEGSKVGGSALGCRPQSTWPGYTCATVLLSAALQRHG